MHADNKTDDGKGDDNGGAEEIETFNTVKKDISEVEVATVNFQNRKDMEKKLLWKLDMRLMPLMMLICTRSLISQ